MTPSLLSGDHLLVVVDYYSRYMEVEVLKSTTADKVIASLRKIFLTVTHGLPVSITTDNGPQFISEEFCKFVEEESIEHRRVTPLWPQANGEVERQNRSLLKRTKKLERRTWFFPNNVQNYSAQHNWSKPCRTPVPQKAANPYTRD